MGKQVIMSGSDYSHRHPVLRSESENSQETAGSSQRAAGSDHARESD